ncbi:fasciclin domain containing protein [Rhodotorula toruloides]|uniref:Fasciclin domain containing protein n=1 Tax=Rhodotorula toruloides TaxID=5286 RepID=A0A511KD89_RHOTO|nr:fasciclin domain containing protein [Rhodotorula toruloides]
MRLLELLLWLPAFAAIAASAKPHPAPPDTSHIVDVLSASPGHQLLLAAFQRARLIPTLNRLNGSTLFAPTDEAIRRERDREKERTLGGAPEAAVWTAVVEWVDEGKAEVQEHDNLQLALRDTLLYHVLNFTLLAAPASNDTNSTRSKPPETLPFDVPVLEETLYFPSLFPYNRSFPTPPTLPGTEPDRPDPDAPKGRQEGLLHDEGQRLRVLKRKGEKEDELWVGVDWKGEGGVKTTGENQFARNGVFISLDEVLHKPDDLATIIRTTPELSTFASLLPPSILDYLSTAPHLTLFLPTNDAWSALTDLEMRYLRSGFADNDLSEIFGDAASQSGVGKAKVGYLERLVGEKADGKTQLETIRNTTLEVHGEGDATKATVNGTAIERGDILAKNGVIHLVPSLLLPSGSLMLTAEKYLIALDATHFVALLRSVNLSHYVQVPSNEQGTVIDTPRPPPLSVNLPQRPLSVADEPPKPKKERYTILAVKDDVLAHRVSGNSALSSLDSPISNGRPLPPAGSEALRELLEYHIVSGQWRPSELEDGMLVGTELRTQSLGGERQRIMVGVQGEEDSRGEGWERSNKGKKGKRGDEDGAEKELITWGGANVVADPVVIGDSIIFLVSALLEPPPTAITAAVSDLRLSTFVASVYAAALDGTLATQPAVTYLVPTNAAFGALGLTMQYLLLPTSRSELRSVLEYHAVDEVVYLDDFPRSGGSRYPTLLDGSEIYFEREPVDSTLSVHGPTLGGLPANGEPRDAAVLEGNVLTETGVMHVIDQVELPPELEITLEKLLRGAKANTMIDLIRAANMTWVLDGKKPPRKRSDGEEEKTPPDLTTTRKKKTRHDASDQAYTILCPTDKAFGRLNLTCYLSNPTALSRLVRLHVIPTTSSSTTVSPFPPRSSNPGLPLVLEDAKSYDSLLSKNQPGGSSRYGALAFKKWGGGEDDWMVGIRGARGTKGESDAARVLAWGRATPRFVSSDKSDEEDGEDFAAVLGSTVRLAAAGGVISIDSVLIPYEPGWFRKWGWIVALVAVLVSLVAVGAVFAVRWWRKRQQLKYERLMQEEDD